MNTELTIIIESEIFENAQKYARNNKITISEMIESYLKTVTNVEGNKSKSEELSPVVKTLKGSFTMSQSIEYDHAVTDYLAEKYLQ